MKRSRAIWIILAVLLILYLVLPNEEGDGSVLMAKLFPEAAYTHTHTQASSTASPEPTPVPTPTPAPVELYGVSARWDTKELDLHDISIRDDGAALIAAIPSLPRLQRVDMTGCGLSNERMGKLQEEFPDITFVWMLHVFELLLPSDGEYFINSDKSGLKLSFSLYGPQELYYARNLRSLDLGHCNLSDVSFIANMPHLRHLILADNIGFDLSPLYGLKELEWLELFGTYLEDISPQLGCTALRDLNLCYVVAPADNLFDTLSQMTWLRRLWISGTSMSNAQIEALREALPDTEIWSKLSSSSTGSTWRCDEDYYDMRDAFHMYYMDSLGNKAKRMTEEELAAVHEKYWGY